MSWRISYTLPQAELSKLCGQRMEADILADADLFEDFLDECSRLRPVIVCECEDCGFVAELRQEQNGIGLPEITVADLQCDCEPVEEHTEADDWNDAKRWKELVA